MSVERLTDADTHLEHNSPMHITEVIAVARVLTGTSSDRFQRCPIGRLPSDTFLSSIANKWYVSSSRLSFARGRSSSPIHSF